MTERQTELLKEMRIMLDEQLARKRQGEDGTVALILMKHLMDIMINGSGEAQQQ
jgi:hypothetical protein